MYFLLKKYKFGFEWRGLVLFLVIMIPNFIWFVIPTPNDILRTDSLTPKIDSIATVCQIAFVVCLCLLIRTDSKPFCITGTIKGMIVSVVLYYFSWGLYYLGVTNAALIMGLTIFPCIAFLLFAINRHNVCAIIPISLFTVCHLVYATVNFIA